MEEAARILHFPTGEQENDQPEASPWITRYINERLALKNAQTTDAYGRILRDFADWLPHQAGSHKPFLPTDITATAVKTYFTEKKKARREPTLAELHLIAAGQLRKDDLPLRYAPTSLARMKVALTGFVEWLIVQEQLYWNPVKEIAIPKMAVRPPRLLTPEQRYALRNVVERATAPRVNKRKQIVPGDLRGQAMFALGYYAGLRVSDVSHLTMVNTHVSSKSGWLHAGHKREAFRDIDLVNEARKPLFEYLEQGTRQKDSAYVFTSQRCKKATPEEDFDGWRLTEDAIHQWFQEVRLVATVEEAALIDDITFHDLRHDFAHRLREQGWSLEEVAYYLGHVTASGEPSLQTTLRYTQVGRDQIKQKIRSLDGI